MNTRAMLVILSGLSPAAMFSNAIAAPQPVDADARSPVVSEQDKKLLDMCAKSANQDVAIAEVGVQKAVRPDVMKFARTELGAHTSMRQSLLALAHARHLTLPTTLDLLTRTQVKALGLLSEARFEHEFLRIEIMNHKRDIKDLQTTAKSADDQELRAWAAKALPLEQMCLDTLTKLFEPRDT